MRRWRAWASILLAAAIILTCCGGLAETAGLELSDVEVFIEASELTPEASVELDAGLVDLLETDLQLDMSGEMEIADMPELFSEGGDEAMSAFGTDGADANPSEGEFGLTVEGITLGVGEKFDLMTVITGTPGEDEAPLKFKSSDRAIVRVNADGIATGRKKGSARITVTGPDGLKATCEVRVLKAPQSVKLSANRPRLEYDPETGKGQSTRLVVELPSGTASAIRFSDYDESVVTVTEDGKVKAVGLGETSITANTFNGKQARCTVRVFRPGEIRTGNIAHRGGAGYWEENTLEAFRNVASTGATGIELDVRTTSDGVQVVHHDKAVKKGSKKYEIKSHSYSRLRKVKPSLCTLDEALEVISATGLDLFLELKDTADPRSCVSAVKRYGMQKRTTYISFNSSLLKKVRKLDKQARLGYLFSSTSSSIDSLVNSLKLDVLCQKKGHLSRANVVRWQRQGLQVNVWTVDSASEMRKYADWGVDYITSNYPKQVTQVLDE